MDDETLLDALAFFKNAGHFSMQAHISHCIFKPKFDIIRMVLSSNESFE